MTTTVDVDLAIDASFQGTELVNFAEISEADNALGLADDDSTPDDDDTNDAGGNPDTASDDVVGGDGSGMPGDEDAGTDEDDHDPASVTIGQVFDLALRKELSSAGPIAAGTTVTFTITVFNQGTLDATDIVISDYVPVGMTLVDGDWNCLLYTSPSPRDRTRSRMPSSA